jgi:hypothetical protein
MRGAMGDPGPSDPERHPAVKYGPLWGHQAKAAIS